MFTLPTLYKKTSTGKIQLWEIKVNDAAQIITRFGQVDGKIQTASDFITEGKNIGKSNETTPLEQAESEATSQWEKKIKKGYVQNIEDAQDDKIDTNAITGGVEPMLAFQYEKQGHKIKYPAFVQPKLDGHRCIAIIQDGVCTLWSRTRKPINSMPHIVAELEKLVGNKTHDGAIVFDGELYNHDYRDKFEQLTSKIKQEKPMPGHEVVQYWVYDVAETTGTFSARNLMLNGLAALTSSTGSVVVVDTQTVDNEEDMIAAYGVYMNFGFEGLMVRNATGIYKNKRSYDLQKVKTMMDSEFVVVDVIPGKGKMADKALFRCLTPEGKEFGVKMMGTLESLVQYLDNKDDYIGKELTVKFQNLTEDGIPRFPIGLRFREDI